MKLTIQTTAGEIRRQVDILRKSQPRKEVHPLTVDRDFVAALDAVKALVKVTITPAMCAALVALLMDVDRVRFRKSRLREMVNNDPFDPQIGEAWKKMKRYGYKIQRYAESNYYLRGRAAVDRV